MVVIEEEHLPIPFGVAALAVLTKTSFMFIILLMAAIALDGRLVCIQMPLVAGLALGADMPPS
jgi:hypothetical protein